MMTTFFFWIGIICTLLISIAILIVFASFVYGWCKSAYRHGEMLYNRSKMCKHVTASIGHSCALWLINYNERHGFKYSTYTAGKWERYFGEQMKRDKQ